MEWDPPMEWKMKRIGCGMNSMEDEAPMEFSILDRNPHEAHATRRILRSLGRKKTCTCAASVTGWKTKHRGVRD